MKLKIYQIDAFTNTIFKGNSAAVIILDEWLEVEMMQSIAIKGTSKNRVKLQIIL